jgi:hypothetical protein
MAFYEDLSHYNYTHHSKRELNIGWLEKGQPFNMGEVPAGFIDRLNLYLNSDFTLFHCLGDHDCEFCEKRESACCEIRVVSIDGQVYAAPELIKHYIEAHSYLPPQEFIDAVMNGPAPGTKEYGDIVRRLPESWEQRLPDINDKDYEKKMMALMMDRMSGEVDSKIIKEVFEKNPDFKKFIEAYNKIMPAVYEVGITGKIKR